MQRYRDGPPQFDLYLILIPRPMKRNKLAAQTLTTDGTNGTDILAPTSRAA